MKKGIYLALCLTIVASSFAGCGDTHTHEYAQDYTHDAYSHWHAATCEHTDEKSGSEGHRDELINSTGAAGSDNICDVCGRENLVHIHTYETAWSKDATTHYKKGNCAHTDEKTEIGAHVDENNDGACDVCGFDADHEHTYGTNAWQYLVTETGHSAIPTCGHDIAADEEEDHTDPNAAGKCNVCGYQIEEAIIDKYEQTDEVDEYDNPIWAYTGRTVENALAVAAINHTEIGRSEFAQTIETPSEDSQTVTSVINEWADGYAYRKEVGEWSTLQYWYTILDDGTLWAVLDDGYNGISIDEYATVEQMAGCSFGYTGDTEIRGVEAYLASLYTAYKAEKATPTTNVTPTESVEGKTYSFSYDYATWQYYTVKVTFTLNDANAIASFEAEIKTYSNEADYDETGAVLMNSDSKPIYMDGDEEVLADYYKDGNVYKLTGDAKVYQTKTVEGEQFERIFEVEDWYVTSVSLKDKDGNDVEEITIERSSLTADKKIIYFGDIKPFTGNMATASIKYELEGGGDYQSALSIVNNPYDPEVFMSVKNAFSVQGLANGTYYLNVIVNGELADTLTITVVDPVPTKVEVAVYSGEGEDADCEAVLEGVYSMYVGKTALFGIKPNKGTRGCASATIDNNGTLTKQSFVYNDETFDVYTFAPTAAGTYTVTLTSTVEGLDAATLTVTVKEIPNMKEAVKNGFADEWESNTLTFTEGETAGLGTVVFKKTNNRGQSTQYDYTYTVVDNVVTLTAVDQTNLYEVRMTDDYGFAVFYKGTNQNIYMYEKEPFDPVASLAEKFGFQTYYDNYIYGNISQKEGTTFTFTLADHYMGNSATWSMQFDATLSTTLNNWGGYDITVGTVTTSGTAPFTIQAMEMSDDGAQLTIYIETTSGSDRLTCYL